MNFLIGVGLLIWAVGVVVWGQFFSDGITSQHLVQMSVALVGSIIILLPELIDWFMNMKIPKPKPKPEDQEDQEDEIELDGATDYNDFKALNYLKDRSSQIGSKEAFDLVVKLNTLIFSGKEFTNDK